MNAKLSAKTRPVKKQENISPANTPVKPLRTALRTGKKRPHEMGISPAIFTARPLRNFQARQNAAANRRAKYKKNFRNPYPIDCEKMSKGDKKWDSANGNPIFSNRILSAYFALKSEPALNLMTLEALILIFSLVLGLIPVRALRSATENVPKPMS